MKLLSVSLGLCPASEVNDGPGPENPDPHTPGWQGRVDQFIEVSLNVTRDKADLTLDLALITSRKIRHKIKNCLMTNFKLLAAGCSAASGVATGPICHLTDAGNLSKVSNRCILVLRHATPAVTPILSRSAGVVSLTGGRCCHLAILCREMGIPCITQIGEDFLQIPEGTIVFIDANKGLIYGKVSNILKHSLAQGCATKEDNKTYIPILNVGIYDSCFNQLGKIKLDIVLHEVASFTFAIEILADRAIQDIKYDGQQLLVSKQDLLDASEGANLVWLNPEQRKGLVQSYILSALHVLRGSYFKNLLWDYFNLWLITWMAFLGAERIASNSINEINEKIVSLDEVSRIEWESRLTSYTYLRTSFTQCQDQSFWLDTLDRDAKNLANGSTNPTSISDSDDCIANHQMALRTVNYIMERKNPLLLLCKERLDKGFSCDLAKLLVPNSNSFALNHKRSNLKLQERLMHHYEALRH